MAKEEWGSKRSCLNPACGARFYDLKRNPIVCPRCGTEFDPQTAAKPRRPRPAAPAPERKDVASPTEIDVGIGAPEEAGDEDDVIGRAPRFDEDEDDAEVFEAIDGGDAAAADR